MRGILVVGVLAPLVACRASGEFTCTTSEQCRGQAGAKGTCQADGHCTFADVACASGQRYADNAGEDLAGACFGATDAGVVDAATPRASGDPGTSD